MNFDITADEMLNSLDTSHYVKIIGSNVRYERKKRNLTIEELADMIGMAPGFLGLIERGQRGTSLKNLVRLSGLFGVSLDQLITIDIRALELTGFKESKDRRKAYLAKLAALTSIIRDMSDTELDFMLTVAKAAHKFNLDLTNELKSEEPMDDGEASDDEPSEPKD